MVSNLQSNKNKRISKALIHYAGFKVAGMILGAASPVVMVSRADTAEAKLHSIALACLAADRERSPLTDQ